MEINKAFLKRLEKRTNEELLITATAFKLENHTNSSVSFQKNYNTLIFELQKRKLIKNSEE